MRKFKRIALTDQDGTPRDPECKGGRCPSVFQTENGDLIVQGATLKADDRTRLDIPKGEDAVLVPRSLVEQLVARWTK